MKKLIVLSIRLVRMLFGPLFGLVARLLAGIFGDPRQRTARRLARLVLSECSRLGFTKKIVTGKKKVARQRVRFEEPLLMTHDELWCPIDLAKLPTGVRTDDLREESVLRSIEDRLNCSVRLDTLCNGKLCFVVRMGGAAFPEKFSVNAIEWPPEAPQLAFAVGLDRNGDQTFLDLADLVHLLIAGATGGGKTNLQHTILTGLISRNSADDMELWLIDLKQTEFNLYRPLISKKDDGIVKTIATIPEDAIDVLERALREINRRNNLMAQHNATSLSDLSSSTGIRIKRVVLFIDEFAQLTLNTTKLGKQSIGKIAENLITRIAALGRSAGFSIVIATQMVQREVISSLIRANFENRIAFSVADWRQSQLVVETSEADGLPRGRAIVRVAGRTNEFQTPLITPRQVRIEVERIAQFGPHGSWGEDLELARFVKDAKLLIQAACQHFDGELARAKVLNLEGVKGVVSFERFNEVTQRLERDGVLEPGGPRRPRRVSRGFYGRPALLDNLYGQAPTVNPTVTDETDYGVPSAVTVGDRPDAEKPIDGKIENTVYGVQKTVDHAPPTVTPEVELEPPTWWRQIEPEPVHPKRARIARPGSRRRRKG